MDRHPVRQDHLPEPGVARPTGEHASLSTDAAPISRVSRPGPTLPLLVWLAVQVFVVLVATSRLPLWAKFPENGELLTLRLLLCAQIVTSALLFPFLLRNVLGAVFVIASAWPMTFLAAAVSAQPNGAAARAACVVSSWLLLLALWRAVLRTERTQLVATAFATSAAAAGPILHYLSSYYGNGSPIPSVASGPVTAAHAALLGGTSATYWFVYLAVAMPAIAVFFQTRRRGERV